MQKYWLQSASQPFSGLPSLVSAGRPVSRPANCLRALKHLFQLALPSGPQDFTFSLCHLHITLNQNPQWATGRGKKNNKKEGGRNKTVASRFRSRHTALYEMEMWQDITACVCVHICVTLVRVCVLGGSALDNARPIEIFACECLCLLGAELCVNQQARETKTASWIWAVIWLETQRQREDKNGDMYSVHLSFPVLFCRMLCRATLFSVYTDNNAIITEQTLTPTVWLVCTPRYTIRRIKDIHWGNKALKIILRWIYQDLKSTKILHLTAVCVLFEIFSYCMVAMTNLLIKCLFCV